MLHRLRPSAVRVTLLLLAVASLRLPAFASPPPADAFFRPAAFASPQISPDGRRLAALTLHDGRRYALTLLDLASGKAEVLVKHAEVGITYFEWKGDERILVVARNSLGLETLQAIDLSSRKLSDLSRLNSERSGPMVYTLPDDPHHVLAPWNDGGLRLIDLRTGRPREIARAVPGVASWITDPEGNVWAGAGHQNEKWTFVWRTTPDGPWQRREQQGSKAAALFPLGIERDRRHLIVVERPAGADRARLARFELATATTTPLVEDEHHDVTALLTWGFHREPVAAIVQSDRLEYRFFEETAGALYRTAAASLPGLNLQFTSFSRDGRSLVVHASGARHSGAFYLLDVGQRRISPLGAAHPRLPASALADAQAFAFETRGGQKITGRITRPAGDRPAPLLVRVGPGLPGPRPLDGFDPVAQFFASRGFASVQFAIRGSAGYGAAFQRAGDLQLTSGMVDDLEDGVAWLERQGWIEAGRVALLGTDAGGLIAFHAAQRPVFRALLNFESPVFVHKFDLAQLSPSDRDEDELRALLPAGVTANHYLRQLDPLKAAAAWRVPSFHYYPPSVSDGRPLEDPLALERVTRKLPVPAVFFPTPPINEKTDLAALRGEVHEAAVAFLRKHLHSSSPP